MKHIRSFDEPELYLYISSVIVDQTDKLHKSYTKALVYDFGRRFVLGRTTMLQMYALLGHLPYEGGGALWKGLNFLPGKFQGSWKEMKSWAIDCRTLAQQTISDPAAPG